MTLPGLSENVGVSRRGRVLGEMLGRWGELQDPGGRSGGGGGGFVPLMPHAGGCLVYVSSPAVCSCWRRDVVEVERLLGVMRGSGEVFGGVSVRLLRVHVVGWFVLAVRVGRWFPAPRVRGRRLGVPSGQEILSDGGGVFVPSVYRVSVWRPGFAVEGLALLGVEWLAENWGLGHEPCLPLEDSV
jgi:hypothetical protein